MLKKVLRYDVKYMRRSWTLFAVMAVVLSAVASLMIRHSMYIEQKEMDAVYEGIAAVEIMLAMFAIMFVFATNVILLVRIFKRCTGNFFSDEGYLTFTLPVSRKTLYHAKILNGLIWTLLQSLLMCVCLLFLVTIPSSSEPWGIDLSFFYAIGRFLRLGFETTPVWFTVFLVELVILVISAPAFEVLFIHYCIIRGGTSVNRGRAGAAIGIFLGTLFGAFFVFVIAITTSVAGMSYLLSDTEPNLASLVIVLLMLALIGIVAGFSVFFYFSSIDRLENKLNLS